MEISTEQSLEEAFPAAEAGVKPFGSRVLVQIRNPKSKTAAGIILDCGTQETEKWNTQVGKVIRIGPLAFKNRNTMEAWPEGEWCKVDEFVRVPKYGGERWDVKLPNNEGSALFVIYNDLDIIGSVVGDPLQVKAFI